MAAANPVVFFDLTLGGQCPSVLSVVLDAPCCLLSNLIPLNCSSLLLAEHVSISSMQRTI